MVFSSYFIFNNRYKVSFLISFLLTVGLLILFSNIPVKESSLKEKSIIITFTEEIAKNTQEVITEEPPIPEKVIEKAVPEELPKPEIISEITEDTVEEVPISKPVDEAPQADVEDTIPEDAPALETASKNLKEIIEEVESEYIEIDSLPKSTVIVEPKYPKTAIKWSMEGTVEVEICVLKNGKISEISLLKSSGHKVLDNECIKTIKKNWKLPDLGHEYKIFKRFVFLLK